MKKIVFDKAHVKSVRFKVSDQAMVGFVEMIGRLTPQIAEALGSKWSCYDNDGMPKNGYTKIELDTELTQCKVRLEVTGAANFVLDLTSPTINKFVVVRVGGKKKAKSTYLAVKFLCGVMGREQELIAFLKTAGMAEGQLVIDEMAAEQAALPGTDGKAIQEAVAQVAGKAKGMAAPKEKPIAFGTRLASVVIQLRERDGAWHTDVVAVAGLAEDAVKTKGASVNGQSSRAAALVEALDKVAGWARIQGRTSEKESVQNGAKEIVAWCADRMAELQAASEVAMTPATPITFADLDVLRVLEFDKQTHRAAIRVGTIRDGGEAIGYEVEAVANADQAEPVVSSWTSNDADFETLEGAVIAAAAEMERLGKKLMADAPKRSKLEAQGREIAAWAGGVLDDAEGILARRPGRIGEEVSA